MERYYLLSVTDTPAGPVAYSPDDAPLGIDLISEMENKRELSFDFTIKWVTETKRGLKVNNDLNESSEIWEDYLPNNSGVALMSLNLKSIIDRHITDNEPIDWITCKVNANKSSRIYYILRFNKPIDVLDMEKSKFLKGTDIIMNACFSISKIKDLNVFTTPTSDELYKININVHINESIKKDIENNNINGVAFKTIKLA